jgi:beta-glucanase (GH16 family)
VTSTFVRRHVWRRFAPIAMGTVLGCTSSSATSRTDTPNTSPTTPTGRQLVWSDEFDGAAGGRVDNSRWRHDLGDGCQASNCGWGNNEKEYYTSDSENIALNGQGQLAITARRAPGGLTCYYGPCRYTSAKITTRGLAAATQGRVEARIKLASGQGLWPAFWLLGNNIGSVGWPQCGEIDIMENHGSDVTSISSALHGPGYSGNTPFVRSYQLASTSFADDFHVFAVEWNGSRVEYSVDGKSYHVVQKDDVLRRGNWVFDQSFFVILNLAVGGNFDGDPKSDAILPATMLVDYVRVYE